MEANNENGGKSVRKNSSQVMELKQLIAGPLVATIEADALSSQKYLDYLMQVTFESYNPATGETGKIRTLTFSYTENDNGTEVKRTVSIPLITLVPLPLLHIEEADFDFDIKIVDCITEKYDSKFGQDESASGSDGFRMRSLSCSAEWVAQSVGRTSAEHIRQYEGKGQDAHCRYAGRSVQPVASERQQSDHKRMTSPIREKNSNSYERKH